MTTPHSSLPLAAAPLARYPERWSFASRFVRETIRYGYVPPFTQHPPPFHMRNPPREPEAQAFIYTEIDRMIALGVVTEVERAELWCVNPTFAVPKKGNNKWRFILNTKRLNGFVEPPRFKYQDLGVLAQRLQPDDHLCSVDLKDGFWQLPLHPSVRKYFGFAEVFPDGTTRYFRFDRVCFGLCSAPHVFQKVAAAAAAFISQEYDLSVNCFLDDYACNFPADRPDAPELLVAGLEHLGFVVNRDKSQLEPTQELEYLGMIVDTTGPEPQYRVPAAKIRAVRSDIRRLLRASTVKPRALSRVLGKLCALTRAILPARTMLRSSYDMLPPSRLWDTTEVTLSPASRADLTEWLEKMETWNGRVVAFGSHDHVLQTYASKSGGGATLDGGQPVAFPFPPEWRDRSSNARELVTVLHALEAYGSQLFGKRVRVLTDNTATMSYINHIFTGRSPGLYAIARRMFHYCQDHNITLLAAHVPGVENVSPDWLSRVRLHDWGLTQSAFDILQQLWPCTIDRFASHLSKKLERYNSRFKDMGSEAPDALSLDWAAEPGASYLCPPFPLLLDVTEKIIADRVVATLICPLWPTAPFLRLLSTVIVEPPIELDSSHFTPAPNGRCAAHRFRMLACRVRGDLPDSQRRSLTYWLSMRLPLAPLPATTIC